MTGHEPDNMLPSKASCSTSGWEARQGLAPSGVSPWSASVLEGALFFRDREPEDCTGISASWCPNCGDCTCNHFHYTECPLHAENMLHGYQSGIYPWSHAPAIRYSETDEPCWFPSGNFCMTHRRYGCAF